MSKIEKNKKQAAHKAAEQRKANRIISGICIGLLIIVILAVVFVANI